MFDDLVLRPNGNILYLGQKGVRDGIVTALSAYDVLQSVDDEPRRRRTLPASEIQHALDPDVIHHVFPQGYADAVFIERREPAQVRLVSLPSVNFAIDLGIFLGGDLNRRHGHGNPLGDERSVRVIANPDPCSGDRVGRRSIGRIHEKRSILECFEQK